MRRASPLEPCQVGSDLDGRKIETTRLEPLEPCQVGSDLNVMSQDELLLKVGATTFGYNSRRIWHTSSDASWCLGSSVLRQERLYPNYMCVCHSKTKTSIGSSYTHYRQYPKYH